MDEDEDRSERKAPPLAVKRDIQTLVRREAELIGGAAFGARMMRHGGESLPVLETFRAFLEQERRRARNRLIAATVCFVVVLLGVLVGAWFVVDHLRHEVDTAQDQLGELREGLAEDRAGTQALVARLRERDETLREDVDQRLTAAEEERRVAEERNAQRARNLALLDAAFKTLEVESAEIGLRYAALERELAAATNRIDALASRPVPVPEPVVESVPPNDPPSGHASVAAATPPAADLPAPEIVPTRGGPVVGAAADHMAGADAAPPAAGAVPSIPITITPRGADVSIPWRLPMP